MMLQINSFIRILLIPISLFIFLFIFFHYSSIFSSSSFIFFHCLRNNSCWGKNTHIPRIFSIARKFGLVSFVSL
ncbi:hypothetical protein PRIPAC_73783 [Pristionchus pacificus]|nr:hypothetical protein PRIPAC_73783 [Pristionchus pacificus]